jgi:uridine phosphorylase
MKQIAPSELIINGRGAIYHLNVKPEELAGTVITVGDPDRVDAVSKHFDSIEHKSKHREFVTHTGYVGKKRLSVISTGIGPDNIDIVLNELDALANINFETRTINNELKSLNIIRIGTSGSLQKNIPVDSYVVSTHGLGIDNLLNFYRTEHSDDDNLLLQSFITQTQFNNRISAPYVSSASASLIKHFVDGYHHGITVTCPGFYGPQGRVLRLGLANPQLIDNLAKFTYGSNRITNFEMETAAIYGLGKLLGHHCLSVSAIVANRIEQQFSKNGQAAVASLIEKTLGVVAGLM